MSAKFDFKKACKPEYSGKAGIWQELEVSAAQYLMLRGQGDPEGADFAAALAALYPLAYGVKFHCKGQGADFTVPPLQALWQAEDPAAFTRDDRAAWQWSAMIRMPAAVTGRLLEEVRAAVLPKQAQKKQGGADPALLGADPALLGAVSLEELHEGECLQMLHLGPYRDEGPALARLHSEVMPAAGLTFNGAHHEIYLSDPRRTAPERLKTLLRQPVRKV